jgi:hypothetical protein
MVWSANMQGLWAIHQALRLGCSSVVESVPSRCKSVGSRAYGICLSVIVNKTTKTKRTPRLSLGYMLKSER